MYLCNDKYIFVLVMCYIHLLCNNKYVFIIIKNLNSTINHKLTKNYKELHRRSPPRNNDC